MIDVLKLMNNIHNTQISDIEKKMQLLEERLNSPIVMPAPHPPKARTRRTCITPASTLHTIMEEAEHNYIMKQ